LKPPISLDAKELPNESNVAQAKIERVGTSSQQSKAQPPRNHEGPLNAKGLSNEDAAGPPRSGLVDQSGLKVSFNGPGEGIVQPECSTWVARFLTLVIETTTASVSKFFPF
jgi:hypothetical protein